MENKQNKQTNKTCFHEITKELMDPTSFGVFTATLEALLQDTQAAGLMIWKLLQLFQAAEEGILVGEFCSLFQSVFVGTSICRSFRIVRDGF